MFLTVIDSSLIKCYTNSSRGNNDRYVHCA
nr:MAG TPA: hypothetical protein [Caudoviricetes sp.]